MPITGSAPITYDSVSNEIGFITADNQVGRDCTVTNETIGLTRSLGGTINFVNSQIRTSGYTGFIEESSLNRITLSGDTINFTRTTLIHNSTETFVRLDIYINNLIDSIISVDMSNTDCNVYTKGNLENVIFQGGRLTHEVYTAWDNFFNVTYLNTKIGMLNWNLGRLDRFGINIPSTASNYFSWLGAGDLGTDANSFWDWNRIAIDKTKIVIENTVSAYYLGYTASWIFVDTLGATLANVQLRYRDDRDSVGGAKTVKATYTTNSSGIPSGTTNSQFMSEGSNIARTLFVLTEQSRLTGGTYSTGLVEPVSGQNYVMDAINFEVEIKSYLHLAPELLTEISSQIGLLNADLSVAVLNPFVLSVDPGVTETNTSTVSGYSGITNSAGSFTLSGSLTLSQVYDSRKLYWRNNDSVSTPTQQGEIANFGTANITISAPSNSPASTAKYTHFRTTGTVTLSATGTYLNGSVPATGIVLVIAGETYLPGWTFASGATINRVSGSATVYVDANQVAKITAGTGVTIEATPISIEVAVNGAPVGASIGVFKRLAPLVADRSQFTLASGNNSGNSTLVISTAISRDTPTSGFVRVLRNDGSEDRLAYSSRTGSTFTLSGTLPVTYSAGNGAYVGYLDVLSSATGDESNIVEYVADRDCVLTVRKGSGTGKIEDVRTNLTITSSDSIIPVNGILDSINDR